MLEVIADIARQDEERFEQGWHRGARDRIFLLLALDGAVLQMMRMYWAAMCQVQYGTIRSTGTPSKPRNRSRRRRPPHRSELGGDHPARDGMRSVRSSRTIQMMPVTKKAPRRSGGSGPPSSWEIPQLGSSSPCALCYARCAGSRHPASLYIGDAYEWNLRKPSTEATSATSGTGWRRARSANGRADTGSATRRGPCAGASR